MICSLYDNEHEMTWKEKVDIFLKVCIDICLEGISKIIQIKLICDIKTFLAARNTLVISKTWILLWCNSKQMWSTSNSGLIPRASEYTDDRVRVLKIIIGTWLNHGSISVTITSISLSILDRSLLGFDETFIIIHWPPRRQICLEIEASPPPKCLVCMRFISL